MKNITKIEIKEDVLIVQEGKEDILLEAGDTIRVFSEALVEEEVIEEGDDTEEEDEDEDEEVEEGTKKKKKK